MDDQVKGNVQGSEGVAVGKNIQQQLITVTSDLNNTLQGVRDELRWMRRDMDTLTQQISRQWFMALIVVAAIVFLSVVGDRRINALEGRVNELERQVTVLERRVEALSRMP